MSQKPSHIPLFPDAYHRDTTHLTPEEHGAYLLLLMAAWGTEDCSMPNDERRLAALSKTTDQRWRERAPTGRTEGSRVGEEGDSQGRSRGGGDRKKRKKK